MHTVEPCLRPALACSLLLVAVAACAAPTVSGPPSSFDAEVKRLLEVAAAHATHSQACVDGHGHVLSIEALTVTVERNGDARTATAAYTVVDHAEGDTRMCGRRGNCADEFPTTRTPQRVTLPFDRARNGYVLTAPAALPGLRLITPLAAVHDTGCYGKKPAWQARPVPLDAP